MIVVRSIYLYRLKYSSHFTNLQFWKLYKHYVVQFLFTERFMAGKVEEKLVLMMGEIEDTESAL